MLAQRFESLTTEWEKYYDKIWYSSDTRDFLNHPAYHQLIQLGRVIIPYIMERYKKDNLPWEFVLQEITGISMMDDPHSYKPEELKARWLKWWEAERGKKPKP